MPCGLLRRPLAGWLSAVLAAFSTKCDRKPTTQCPWKKFSFTNVNHKDSSETLEIILRGNRTLITPINCWKKGANIKVKSLRFSGALKMANEEREFAMQTGWVRFFKLCCYFLGRATKKLPSHLWYSWTWAQYRNSLNGDQPSIPQACQTFFAAFLDCWTSF